MKENSKYIILLTIFVASIFLSSCRNNRHFDIVTVFPDEVLRNEIIRQLGEERQYSVEDLLSIVEIDITNEQVVDLSGLEELHNLKSLRINCSINSEEELKFLSNFKDVEVLFIIGCDQLENLDFLDYLKFPEKLKKLYISRFEKLNDIAKVEKLVNLEEFSISDCSISNIQPICSLTKLKFLRIAWCENVLDIKYLKSLTELNNVYLYKCGIVNLEGLENSCKLEEVHIEHCNNLTNIDSIKNAVTLKRLYIANCKLNDISVVENFTELGYLVLSMNDIEDIEAIGRLPQLVQLELGLNKITSIDCLYNLTELNYLVISANEITDISVLRNLKDLQRVDLSNNSFSDVSCLLELPKLESVSARNCPNVENWAILDSLKDVEIFK